MNTTIINTHSYIKRLMKNGMSEKLAEEVSNILIESREKDFSQLVTKDYFDAKLESRLNKTKYEIVVWLIGCTLAIIGAMSYFKV